jgi:hypothetical protein
MGSVYSAGHHQRVRGQFMQQVRLTMRGRNLALSTERTYAHRIRMYIRFYRYRHPVDMGGVAVDPQEYKAR